MAYELTNDILKYLADSHAECVELLKTLTLIPAPSHHEDEKAKYVMDWLLSAGAEGVYMDGAKNVILRIEGERTDEAVVFMAHTDTVFPKDTPLVWREDETNYYCPGVGDDTCDLAIMMIVTRYIVQHKLKPKKTVLIVANSCEEGLGNLKGSKQIVSDFGDILNEFYTFDGKYRSMATRCVGSHRYEITVESEGGHSFGAFGHTNSIAELARLITELYRINVPVKENTKTTYNVGLIEGGTSVNTIAQNAKMLYEYRSDDRECLEYMKKSFEETLERVRETSGATFSVNTVGIRPCDGDVDPEKHSEMIELVRSICTKHSGEPCTEHSGSTDCNAASSASIPSVCLGLYLGGGAHTREEWVVKDSIPVGLKICAELILNYFN